MAKDVDKCNSDSLLYLLFVTYDNNRNFSELLRLQKSHWFVIALFYSVCLSA